MKKPILFFCLLLCLAVVARAQDTCGVWVHPYCDKYGEAWNCLFWSADSVDSIFVSKECPPVIASNALHWGTTAEWESLKVVSDTACWHWSEPYWELDIMNNSEICPDTTFYILKRYKVYEPCK